MFSQLINLYITIILVFFDLMEGISQNPKNLTEEFVFNQAY